MTYLGYVWRILLSSHAMVAVTLGNMMVFFCFFRSRFKWWFYPSLVGLTYLSLPIVYKLSTLWFGEFGSYSVLLTCLGYWNILLILLAFRESLWPMISLIFTLCILNRLFTFWGYIMHMPLKAIVGDDLNIQVSITLVIVVMYTLLSVVSWLTLKDKGRKLIQAGLRRQNWIVLASIAVSAKLIIDICSDYVFSLNPYSERKIIWAMIALCIFVLAVLGLYLYSTLTTMKHLELEASTDRLVFEKEAQQRYYETQLHNQDELCRMKHDMNGHLNTIARLLMNDHKNNALDYLRDLNHYAASNQKSSYCEDPYLNAVITNYAELFARNETQFEPDIQIGKLKLHHVELCLILNNAQENALEASLKLFSNQRYVKLQIKTKQNHLLIRVTNRFNKELNFDGTLLRSTKEGDSHGYGLNSIRKAAESVGGFAKYKVEGDMFVLDVAL